nr:uncharacterized protein LOC125184911 [Anser cygnoides]
MPRGREVGGQVLGRAAGQLQCCSSQGGAERPLPPVLMLCCHRPGPSPWGTSGTGRQEAQGEAGCAAWHGKGWGAAGKQEQPGARSLCLSPERKICTVGTAAPSCARAEQSRGAGGMAQARLLLHRPKASEPDTGQETLSSSQRCPSQIVSAHGRHAVLWTSSYPGEVVPVCLPGLTLCPLPVIHHFVATQGPEQKERGWQKADKGRRCFLSSRVPWESQARGLGVWMPGACWSSRRQRVSLWLGESSSRPCRLLPPPRGRRKWPRRGAATFGTLLQRPLLSQLCCARAVWPPCSPGGSLRGGAAP